VNAMNQKFEFQRTDNLGYLSSCPTNLGTGMRASVHIKIPLASAQPEFKTICEQHHIQPRGIHGEHSETAGGVYDISNKRRLGLSEVQCVQDMFEGVKKLIDLEKKLEGASKTENKFPDFPESCHSLLKKHLTREVFELLKDRKTSTGVTLRDCINSGVQNLDSGVGLYAGDEETYKVFEPLFGPLIEDYHKGYKITDKHPSDMDVSHLNAPNPDPEGKYIVSTRIRVARNLRGFPLQPTNTLEGLKAIEQKASESLAALDGELKGTYYPLKGMDEATAQKLVDDHFLFKKGDRFLEAAGINRAWPE